MIRPVVLVAGAVAAFLACVTVPLLSQTPATRPTAPAAAAATTGERSYVALAWAVLDCQSRDGVG